MTDRSSAEAPDELLSNHADPGAAEKVVLAFIETPKGSRNKYEYDKDLKAFKLDRVLFSAVHYPSDYGFIPDTLWDDGDPLDILVLVHDATFPGCLIDARPIGGLDMSDEKGGDFKVVAVPAHDPRYEDVHSLEDLPSHTLLEIANFFETYKILEKKKTEILGWHNAADARACIAHSRVLFQQVKAV